MVLSYCAGGDLLTHMRGFAGAPAEREELARPIARRLVDAVLQIHRHGRAHGDLSLENVLLAREASDPEAAEIRVIDFGCSTGPRATGLRCKPSYQAPELHL